MVDDLGETLSKRDLDACVYKSVREVGGSLIVCDACLSKEPNSFVFIFKL